MSDEELCEKLGLSVPEGGGTHYLGRVEAGDGSGSFIDVTMSSMPARFWELAVWSPEQKVMYRVTTGSGELSEYWDFAVALAEDMLSVERVESDYDKPQHPAE